MNGSQPTAASAATAVLTTAANATTDRAGDANYESVAPTAAFDAAIFVGIPLAAIGFVLDAVTLTALTRLRLSFPSMRVVLASLCLADALLALATIGLLSVEYVGSWHSWPGAGTAEEAASAERRTMCSAEALRWLWDVATSAHLLTLLALAAQQFVSVRWPLQSDSWLSARCSTLAIAAVWAASCVLPATRAILMATATAGDPEVELWPAKGTTRFCYQMVRYLHSTDPISGAYTLPYGQAGHERAAMLAELVVKGSVLLAIAASYGYVFAAVHRLHEHGAAAAAAAAAAREGGYGAGGGSGSGGGHQWSRRRRSDRRRGERRVLITALVVTLLFLACYLPLFCYNMVRIYSDYKHRWPIETGAALLTVVCTTTVLDPVVYAFRLTELRAGVRRAALRRLGLAGRGGADGRLLAAAGDDSAAARRAATLLRLCCCCRDGGGECCQRHGGGGGGTVTPLRTTSALTLSPHLSIDSTKAYGYVAAAANGKVCERGPSPVSSQLGVIEPDATDSLIQGSPC